MDRILSCHDVLVGMIILPAYQGKFVEILSIFEIREFFFKGYN